MARQIIILERLNEPSDLSFRFVMWATVPAARVSGYANASATSAFTGATQAELDALKAGQVVELVDQAFFPAGTGLGVIQAALIARWTVYQAQVNAANKTSRYGTSWDGTSWTAAGTA